MKKILRNAFLFAVLALTSHPVGAVDKVSLHALFKGKAIVMVDTTRRVLSVGDTSPEGVKLVSTDTQEESAEIEIDGKIQQLKLGVIVSSFVSTAKGSVVLYPDAGGHFVADGVVNGANVRFLVDTGATIIALNSITAKRLGIDYIGTGRRSSASTASGIVPMYMVKLRSVEVGTIQLFNVDASVIEGPFPEQALLGMSFLGQLDMKRDSQKLELLAR